MADCLVETLKKDSTLTVQVSLAKLCKVVELYLGDGLEIENAVDWQQNSIDVIHVSAVGKNSNKAV